MLVLASVVKEYLEALRRQSRLSNNTDELSFRDHLGKFLREAKEALGKQGEFTGEARLGVHGRPDYTVTHGLRVVGYVEAEGVNSDLAHLLGSAREQNERFRDNLHNFLQTNHYHFRLFRDGKQILSAKLPEPPEQGAIRVSPAIIEEMQTLLEGFFDAQAPAATSAEAIARQLARRARFLRTAAETLLSAENSKLHPLWQMYRQTLFDTMEKDKFADLYAQTFTYGLFLTWLNTQAATFDRQTALRSLPVAVPPVKVLLQFGGSYDLPEEFEWIVDGICADLDAADKSAALTHRAGIADPLIHFYETFLAAYDPQLRERAGVYYTPDAVVDFIVRAVDDCLKGEFGRAQGLADPDVRLLDPATGTATFLARAYQQVHDTMCANGDGGLWRDRVRNHLAAHFFGFERLPAAYTLAHIHLRQKLVELNAQLPEDVRLPVYLADTMMNSAPEQSNLPGMNDLTAEIIAAKEVRDAEPLLVVLGNPPYFGKSDNPSRDAQGKDTFIGELIRKYYEMDGQPLNERNSKGLQNDYVKFIRFAQWRIERTGRGMVGFITDNSYLDSPTFRGMRRSLMRSFDEIHLLDLHGNSKKKERAEDGGKDENVFDITQGVAVAIFIRRGGENNEHEAVIRHADVYGLRQEKYDYLREKDLHSIEWNALAPNAPFYLFRPQLQDLREEYEGGGSWNITQIFTSYASGIRSHRDSFAIAFNENELKARIKKFISLPTDLECYSTFELSDTHDWKLPIARETLKNNPEWVKDLTPCLYRPFDYRYCLLSDAVMDRPRFEINRHMLSPNLSLITTRQTKEPFSALATNRVCGQHKIVATYDSSYVFPLWLYPQEGTLDYHGGERYPNLAPGFVKAIEERIGGASSPEEIFHYIYAVLHAPTYRTRYAPFLKIDFPRIPLPADGALFHRLAELGAKLTALHLLEDPALLQSGIGFPVAGDHHVKKMRAADRYVAPKPDGTAGRIRLNDVEYFDDIAPAVWEFRVGGYQPAAKWLDDRAERTLSEEEITHYRKALAAMRGTIPLMEEIDGIVIGSLGHRVIG